MRLETNKAMNRGLPSALTTAVLLYTSAGYAGLQIPYTADGNTLHLWHLDDPYGQLYATDAVNSAGITLTNVGLPLPGSSPVTNANFGHASFPGLGTCLYCQDVATGANQPGKAHLLYGGSYPSVYPNFANQTSGAFTFEALVNFNLSPLGTCDAEIVSGDNPLGVSSRGWEWRIYNGFMEWNLLAGAGDNDYKVALPASGPDAATTNTWYHVAVTYTGYEPTNGDASNIITFYWTLLDTNRTYANVLGASYMATRPLDGAPSGAAIPSLGIGGSGRNVSTNPGNNEGLAGSIDEVRISQVCLRSNEMAFANTGNGQRHLSFTLSGKTGMVLDWTGTFSLQSAPSVIGPWSTIYTNGMGPYTVTIGASPQLFYRLTNSAGN
jgi:hypothetical protein